MAFAVMVILAKPSPCEGPSFLRPIGSLKWGVWALGYSFASPELVLSGRPKPKMGGHWKSASNKDLCSDGKASTRSVGQSLVLSTNYKYLDLVW